MAEPTGFSLSDGMDLAGVDADDLWWRYAALGGNADPDTLVLRLVGFETCDPREHDLIAQALNETFIDRGESVFPVAYSGRPLPFARPPARVEHVPLTRSMQARRYAELARLRSVAASRRSVRLHATAARLMRASGQLQLARRAENRAQAARQRAAASAAV